MEEDRLPSLGDLSRKLDVLRPHGRQDNRDAVPYRLINDLQWLTEAGAPVCRQRDLVVAAVMHNLLTPPHLAAYLHDLAGASEWRVVRDSVEPFNDLRAGCPDPKSEPTVGNVVETGRRHRRQRRSTAVQGQDPRRDPQPVGACGDVPQLAHRVEGVQLRHEDDVDPGGLEVTQAGNRLLESATVGQGYSEPHVHPPRHCHSEPRPGRPVRTSSVRTGRPIRLTVRSDCCTPPRGLRATPPRRPTRAARAS